MSHGDAVTRAPEGFRVTAHTDQIAVAAMEDPERGLFAVQFHPEVAHTPNGHGRDEALPLRRLWPAARLDPRQRHRAQRRARSARRSATREVLCALSGGVDSAVAALLVHKAIGDQLTCVFVDNGLHREGEPEQVEETFGRHFRVPLVHVKAADRFLAKLAGVTDPEDKRKAIGEEFIRVFEEVAREHADARFLVQGTLYPDVIESGSRTAAKIKSHHNVGGLPEDMDFELVEPLRDLFKDEVRAVGAELGLPEEIVQRQPFPGPGLAVRIVGEVTAESLAMVRGADAVVREEIQRGRARARDLAGVLRAARRRAERGRDGRRAHVRAPGDRAGGHQRGRDDRGLGAAARRRARPHREPHHPRGPGRQPGGLRHHREAPGHDRVGVS